MRLLFAHDHRFQCGPRGEIYTLGAFPAVVWDRYLDHFNHVHVISRDGGPVHDGECLSRSDHARVTFALLPSLSSMRQLIFRSPVLDQKVAYAVAKADAVVARLPSEIGLLAVRHARLLSKPYAVEVVGCPWDGYVHYGTPSARMYAPLAFLRMRRAVEVAPLALYVTSNWLQQRYPTRGQAASASNVYLLPICEGERAQREARLAAIRSGKRPILGTVASLRTKAKGVHIALAALAQLRASGLDLNYRVLGPGAIESWRQLAENLGVKDLVHFDGTRSAGEAVYAWLDGIDVHLQPSFREGLPRATIEAMSRGVACIGSTCGGIPELLPSERVHRPGDVAGLADTIRRLAADPSRIVAASRRDRKTAQQFDPEMLKKRRYDFYRRLRALAESCSGTEGGAT
jgi:glycosyltransferase involved in cell wall biosynthesis